MLPLVTAPLPYKERRVPGQSAVGDGEGHGRQTGQRSGCDATKNGAL